MVRAYTRAGRGLAAAIAVLSLTVLSAVPAQAEEGLAAVAPLATEAGSQDTFAGLPVVGQHELAHLRGGFTLAGLELEFGATVRTFIDGRLALETLVTFTGAGPVMEQPTLTGPGQEVSREGLARIDLAGLGDARGTVLREGQGLTAALHQVEAGRILGVLISTETGRAIRQELNVDVTVRNFSAFHQAARAAVFSNRMAGALH